LVTLSGQHNILDDSNETVINPNTKINIRNLLLNCNEKSFDLYIDFFGI